MPLQLAHLIHIAVDIIFALLVYIVLSKRTKTLEDALRRAEQRISELENRLSFAETGRKRPRPPPLSIPVGVDRESVFSGFSSADEQEELEVDAQEDLDAEAEPDEPTPALEEVVPELSAPSPVINEKLSSLGEGTPE
jgi:hypothetical protein